MATQSGRILVGALDRIVCSSANYWAAMLSDLAAALVFLALGLNRFSGPWVAAGAVVIVGFMSLGLLEYVVHRWVLHGPPSMARRGHAQHHAEPRALISTPLFVIMTGALTIWGLLGLVLPAGVAGLLVFGLYAGYNYFALVHHWQHHRSKDLACVAYLRRLERLHHLHHHRQVVNFGISTTMWDRLFGTFQPTNGARDGLRLLEHDQIVLDEADLQAERDELRIERHLHPLAAFGGAQAREGCGLEDLPHSHLVAGPVRLATATSYARRASSTLPCVRQMIAANLDLRDPCHGPRGGQFDADEVDSELGLKSPHSEHSVHVAAVDVPTHVGLVT